MRKRILNGAPGQSIFDAALEAYGSLDGLAYILEDNQNVLQNSSDIDGQKLKLRNNYTDKSVVDNIFSKRKPTSI